MKIRGDVAQTLQGLSYKVCFTNIANIFHTGIICSSVCDMRHYTSETCFYATGTCEIIRLYPAKETEAFNLLQTALPTKWTIVHFIGPQKLQIFSGN